jgi:hypothetical protein
MPLSSLRGSLLRMYVCGLRRCNSRRFQEVFEPAVKSSSSAWSWTFGGIRRQTWLRFGHFLFRVVCEPLNNPVNYYIFNRPIATIH